MNEEFEIYTIGDRTAELVFRAAGITNVSDMQKVLDQVEVALKQARKDALRIVPLEWDDFEGQGAKASGFYQANYLITKWRGRGEFEVAMSYPGYQTGFDGERFHPTLEAAKAAAQADYEARILAAVETTPVSVREAARVLYDMPETDRMKAWRATRDAPPEFAKWFCVALRAIAGGKE